ncbi:MAG TPA: CHASE2 domain-containing protein [Rhizomicrobium sp.]|nr:CHASE2 domain-containing protein [Rhizomicrobium sp.]
MASAADSLPRGVVARTWERARRPNRAHVEKLKERVPFWFVALVLFGFATLQIMLNPFGFSDLTQRYAQDVSNLLITGPYLYPTTGRDQVSVVVVDEKSLAEMKQPWQWTYGEHARALDAILSYQPKAVIVDFLFVDQHPDPTIGELADEIRRFQKWHVPIYFEGGIDLPYGETALRPELARTGVPILDPSIETYDGVVRQYPTTGHCYGTNGAEKPGRCLSLALRVYKDLYGANYPADLLEGQMELVWGTKTAPFNEVFNRRSGAPPCNEKTWFAVRLYRAFFDKATAVSKCAYNNYVPVNGVANAPPGDKDLPNLIPGHIVLYGGALQGAQDTSFTPTSGVQPNVFVHAMALDNLITFHGKPERNVMSLFGTTISNNPAQILAIIPVILILSFLHMRRIHARRKGAHVERSAMVEWFMDKGIENLWHWLAFFLALAIGLLLARWVGLSVANWVEVVFVSVELAAMLLIGVPDSFWGYLHHVAGGRPDETIEEATA